MRFQRMVKRRRSSLRLPPLVQRSRDEFVDAVLEVCLRTAIALVRDEEHLHVERGSHALSSITQADALNPL